jgi:hypothetical protein
MSKKSYKTKADFDDAVSSFKSEYRTMKARCLDIDKVKKEIHAKYQAQVTEAVDAHRQENIKLNKWIKELKAEVKSLKTKSGIGLYVANVDIYIAADSFAAAEAFYVSRYKDCTLESLKKLSDSFLTEK